MRTRNIKRLNFLAVIFFITAMRFSTHAYGTTQEDREECLKGSGSQAVSACKRVLNSTPNDFKIHLRLGDLLLELERYEEAAAVFQKAAALKPKKKVKHKHEMAKNLLDEQEWIEKRKAERVDKTTRSKKRIQIKLNRIKCIRLKGAKGLTACDEALKALPDDPVLHNARGNILLQMDLIEEAKVAFMRALRFDPYNSEYLQKLLALGTVPMGSPKSFILKRIALLKSLLDKGLIKEEWFNQRKKRMLYTTFPHEQEKEDRPDAGGSGS